MTLVDTMHLIRHLFQYLFPQRLTGKDIRSVFKLRCEVGLFLVSQQPMSIFLIAHAAAVVTSVGGHAKKSVSSLRFFVYSFCVEFYQSQFYSFTKAQVQFCKPDTRLQCTLVGYLLWHSHISS
jgi:hypothetical protein